MKGYWVVARTDKHFSSMAIDQAHEQMNKIVKTTGGIIGITENPNALKRWMTAGPELSRIISELDDKSCIEMEDLDEQKYHQEGFSAQETFKKYTESLIEVIEIKGNPFLDDFSDFVSLDTRKVFDPSIVTSLRTMNELGKVQA